MRVKIAVNKHVFRWFRIDFVEIKENISLLVSDLHHKSSVEGNQANEH